MKLKHVKHIFFDLDHTLWDFDRNSALTFEKIFKIHGIQFNHEEFIRHYAPINLQYWKLYREERIEKNNLRYRRLKDTFEAISYSVSDDLINQLSEDYITHLTSFNHLFDDTINILNDLSKRYHLHIITNGFDKAQQKKMDNSKISQYFKTVTNAELAGVKKPNPIIFNYALNLAKARPEESLMVGDNYEADILGAIAVGFDAILFNYHNVQTDKDIKTITMLNELRTYF